MKDALEFCGMIILSAAIIALGCAGFVLLIFLWIGFMGGPLWLMLWLVS